MRHLNHRAHRTLAVGLMAVAAFTLSSCIEGDEPIIVEPEAGALFDRYVALGNSITAGFQSGGIHVEMQEEAYPVLLAEKAGASFGVPGLALPGCPPPFVGPLTTERTSTEACGLRLFDAPDVVQNLAVPGATIADASDPIGTGTTLNTLITGGRSQIQAMIDADPSLVSVWLGNNDALGAALSGDTTALTPLEDFQSEYDEVVAAIQATEAEDVVLIGVADPLLVAPALQPGAYFWAIAQNPPSGLPPLDVDDNCAPFTPEGDPNPSASHLVSFVAVAEQIAAGADTIVVDCAATAPGLLNGDEQIRVVTQVAAFNVYIQQQASDNDWIYVDPTTSLIVPALADPNKVRKCQLLETADDPASFQDAVMNSCPVDLDPDTEETFFGSYFSFDGVHPSAEAHAVIADTLAARFNQVHGLSLPVN